MANIKRTPKVLIPHDACSRHIGFLGATGSGKTTAAKVGIVEPALDAGERVIVIDPTAAWWGLRLNRDGIKSAYSIYIFGGDHGDYPLRAKDASLLAEAFGGATDSAIFDVSQMTVAERQLFFTEFAQTILRKNRGPLKLIIDEAHLFMPQAGAKVSGQVPAMLHAGNNLVSLGRSKGLRITLISQRPAKLHKDALSQVQSLVAMRLMAPQDRKAIAEWIADQADPHIGKDIIASLPTLKPGDGWVWSPNDNYLRRTHFPLPRTFDSSKAPDIGDGNGPALKPLNLDALKGKLAMVEKERADNDPKTLKARIVELERAAKVVHAPEADQSTVDTAYKAGFDQGYSQGIATGRQHIVGVMGELKSAVDRHCTEAQRLADMAWEERIKHDRPKAPPSPRGLRVASIKKNGPTGDGIAIKSIPHPDGYSRPQRKVLRALSMWRAIGHEAPSRAMVAAASGYSVSSGGFNNLLGSLTTMKAISIPAPGRLCIEIDEDPVTKDEGRDMLMGNLSNPQRKLVDALKGIASGLTRDVLGESTGYSSSSGGFNNLIGSLSTLGIVVKPAPGVVALSDWAQELLT